MRVYLDRRLVTTAAATAAVALLAFAAPRRALARDEGILEVHTDLGVSPDATVIVDQTILIWVNGARIKHGIAWEIPTRYRERRPGDTGERRAAIEIVRITRDGQTETFSATPTVGGATLRIELGTPAVTLEPGTHVYVLSYRSRGPIAFAGSHDEIEVPVIAGGRALVINQAAVVLHLPEEVTSTVETLDGFVVEPDGAAGPAVAGERRGAGAVVTLTRALGVGEGLAITGTWPKGVVRRPTTDEEVSDFLRDNHSFAFAGVVLLGELLFLFGAAGLPDRRPMSMSMPVAMAAAAPGVDAGSGVVAETPPDGLAAAALRFALRGGADAAALAAALLELEAKGALSIARGDDGIFILARRDGGALTGWERAVVDALLPAAGGTGDSLRVDAGAAGALAAARRALRGGLAEELGDRYSVAARGHTLPALAFTVAASIAVAAGMPPGGGRPAIALGCAAFGLWTAIASAAVAATTRRTGRGKGRGRGGARAAGGSPLARWGATLVVVAIALAAAAALAPRISIPAVVVLAAIGVVDQRLMRRTRQATVAGRELANAATTYRRVLAAASGAPSNEGNDAARDARARAAYAVALGDEPPDALTRAFVAAVSAASAPTPASRR